MRARLAVIYSGMRVELREILLKDKPQSMLKVSPKGTVPVLVLNTPDEKLLCDLAVIDESIDIMKFVLSKNDPQSWYLGLDETDQAEIDLLIDLNDNQFKPILDKYKYASRFPEYSVVEYRQQAEPYLEQLNMLLIQHQYLLGEKITLADIAIFPFIRQFAFVNREWFDTSEYIYLKQWLQTWLDSSLFISVMDKYQPWQIDDNPILF